MTRLAFSLHSPDPLPELMQAVRLTICQRLFPAKKESEFAACGITRLGFLIPTYPGPLSSSDFGPLASHAVLAVSLLARLRFLRRCSISTSPPVSPAPLSGLSRSVFSLRTVSASRALRVLCLFELALPAPVRSSISALSHPICYIQFDGLFLCGGLSSLLIAVWIWECVWLNEATPWLFSHLLRQRVIWPGVQIEDFLGCGWIPSLFSILLVLHR